MVECNMEIKGVGGENGVTQGADVTRNTGLREQQCEYDLNLAEHTLTQCLACCSWVTVGNNFKYLHCQ